MKCSVLNRRPLRQLESQCHADHQPASGRKIVMKKSCALLAAICLFVLSIDTALAAPAGQSSTAVESLPEWKDYMQQLIPAGEAVLKTVPHPDDPQARQETWKALTAGLASAFIAAVYSNADYPEFVSLYNMPFDLMAPEPSYMYTWTPINGAGVYRIRGFRNTAHFVELSFLAGFYANGTDKGTLASLDLDSLVLAPDTSFELILSKERPKGYSGNWFELPPAATNILVRSAAYDWVHERDAILSIERLDVPATPPRMTAEETSARLSALPVWVKGAIRGYERFTSLEAQKMRNKLAVHAYQSMGGLLGQVYLEGIYDIADDEALILETEVPQSCRYWGFLLTDDQFGTIDWMNRQSSLNGFQAKLDKDGKFRAVISVRDAGVPNWLDTGGYRYGIIQGRWNKCSSAPIPTIRKVKLADLRKYLPSDTPTVTAQTRDANLRERRMGAQFRRRW
jgi:hypothetical protein